MEPLWCVEPVADRRSVMQALSANSSTAQPKEVAHALSVPCPPSCGHVFLTQSFSTRLHSPPACRATSPCSASGYPNQSADPPPHLAPASLRRLQKDIATSRNRSRRPPQERSIGLRAR